MDGKDMISVKEYIESRLDDTTKLFETKVDALDKATVLKVDALDKATILASQQMEKRLEGMNEFRESLRDQNATFVRKDEYDTKHEALEKTFNVRVSALELSKAELQGKANQSSVNMSVFFAATGLLISLLSLTVAIVHYTMK